MLTALRDKRAFTFSYLISGVNARLTIDGRRVCVCRVFTIFTSKDLFQRTCTVFAFIFTIIALLCGCVINSW